MEDYIYTTLASQSYVHTSVGWSQPFKSWLGMRFSLLCCKREACHASDCAYLPGAEAHRPPSWRWAHPAEHDALRSAVGAATAGQLPPGLSSAGMCSVAYTV